MSGTSLGGSSTDEREALVDTDVCSVLVVESGGVAWGFESNQVLEIMLERDGHGRALDIARLHGLPAEDASEDRHLILLSMWVQPILVVGRLSILKVERREILPVPDEISKNTKTLVDRVAFRDPPVLLIDVHRIAVKDTELPVTAGSVDLGAQT